MPKELPYVRTSIDGIHLNARHFAAMTKDEAVKEITKGGVHKNEQWAIRAWEQMVEDVRKADAPVGDVAKAVAATEVTAIKNSSKSKQ